jgi:hypothetical protein
LASNRQGVTPFGVTALARGRGKGLLFHWGCGILWSDRNKRALMLFNRLEAGRKTEVESAGKC